MIRSKSPFRTAWKTTQYDAVTFKLNQAKEFAYLRTNIANNLIERLDDITKPLERAADLSASPFGEIGEALKEAGRFDNSIKRFDQYVLSKAQHERIPKSYEGLGECSTSLLPEWSELDGSILPENTYDLITSNLTLHWVNDITETLKVVRRALKPDGVFIASMFGGDTLNEIRASLAISEQEREGGVSPHVSPMLPVADACSVLSAAGLKLVTVDTAQIKVEFDNAFSLMRHLWWMGEGNACTNRRLSVSRETMLATAAIYQHLFGFEENGKSLIPASFNVIFVIGWAPHESQKAPLEPGQGQVSLTRLGKSG